MIMHTYAYYGLDRVEVVGFVPDPADPEGNELVMIELGDETITVQGTELSCPTTVPDELTDHVVRTIPPIPEV
ncbi:MAG: hypothetical protein ABR585_12580 [Gemmatimonadaceae bacterium]